MAGTQARRTALVAPGSSPLPPHPAKGPPSFHRLSVREVAQAIGEQGIKPDVLLLRLGTTLQVPITLDTKPYEEPPAPAPTPAPEPTPVPHLALELARSPLNLQTSRPCDAPE